MTRLAFLLLFASVLAAEEGPEALRVRSAGGQPPPRIGVALAAVEGDITALGAAKGEIGIRVTSVVPGAPAEKGGLRANDILVAVEGKAFEGDAGHALDQLRAAIVGKKSGETISFALLRDKQRQEVKVTLEALPPLDLHGKTHAELAAYHDAPEPSILENALNQEKMADGWSMVAGGVASAAFASATNEPVSPDAPDPFRLGEVNYLLTHPLDGHLVVKGMARDLADALEQGSSPATLVAALARECDLPPPSVKASPLQGDTLEARIDDLASRIAQAQQDVRDALSDLSEDERKFLARASLIRPGDIGSVEEYRRYFRLAAKVKREKMASAACRVLSALGKASLEALAKDPGQHAHVDPPPGVEGEVLLVKETPAGTVVIGGPGRNVYTRPFALIVDVGGEDVYEGPCAAGSLDLPVSVVIDLGGDDIYTSTKEPSQGAGVLGVGILISAGGNDVYTAGSWSQGCGHLGVGVLIDEGGDDVYRADTIAQGAGVAGIGVLASLAGNDSYRVARQGQGYGVAGGAGLALDLSGNDAWTAGAVYRDADSGLTQSMAQGFGSGLPPREGCPLGVSGGIGLLVKVEGNDTYTADDLCQGTGFWYGLGGLYDGRGDDRFVASRFAQGCGVFHGVGVLVSGEGDDTYVCGDVGYAQGCAQGPAVGILADYEGNETYVAGTVSQGAGNEGGIGVLVDFGGNDAYFAKADSQGRGGSLEGKKVASFGLLFDLGGTDLYTIGTERSAEDGHIVTRPDFGLLIDIEDKVHVR